MKKKRKEKAKKTYSLSSQNHLAQPQNNSDEYRYKTSSGSGGSEPYARQSSSISNLTRNINDLLLCQEVHDHDKLCSNRDSTVSEEE
jgi:hypothetical protein